MRSRLLGLAAILGVVALFGAPLAAMVATSLTPPAEVGASFWPEHPTMANYGSALTQVPMMRYFLNTLVLVVFNVGAVLLVCPIVAYSLSKLRWRGRGAVLMAVLATMMLPAQVTLVPLYTMWDKLHLVGTIWPLVIPNFFGVLLGGPFYIYMLRQFFLGIPTAYVEAARVDGAGELRILFRIVVPMAKAAVVTVGLFQFVGTWTDFMNPLIYLRDNTKYTLSMGLYSFVQSHGTDWAPLMAACALFTVPTFLLFLIGQRYFVEGATVGGLK
jgi:multiple sugar transport system permease protein